MGSIHHRLDAKAEGNSQRTFRARPNALARRSRADSVSLIHQPELACSSMKTSIPHGLVKLDSPKQGQAQGTLLAHCKGANKFCSETEQEDRLRLSHKKDFYKRLKLTSWLGQSWKWRSEKTMQHGCQLERVGCAWDVSPKACSPVFPFYHNNGVFTPTGEFSP